MGLALSNYKKPACAAKVVDRFWSKVDQTESCWVWMSAFDQDGYGLFRFPWATAKAHRVAYELVVGPIPHGLVIDHLCRNRACVNPAHMEPVTNRENILRGEVKPPAVPPLKTHCKNGHEFTEANTARRFGGARICVECRRKASREWYHRHKAGET